MEKKDIENVVTESLKPIDFKKKGNYWTLNNGVITKMVHLQKSQFGNKFYINYGFILNSLPLGNLTMHIFNGIGSKDIKTNDWIKNVLDFDTNISKEERILALKKIFDVHVAEILKKINSEDEIRIDLMNRDNLNDISLNVKQYLGMV